jgi:hypothetical protein
VLDGLCARARVGFATSFSIPVLLKTPGTPQAFYAAHEALLEPLTKLHGYYLVSKATSALAS